MRINIFSKVVGWGLVILLLAGCEPGGPQFPAGDYIDTEGFITSFQPDGRFWVRDSHTGQLLTTNGKYSVDEDVITFAGNVLCPQGEGVYKWTLSEDQLLFELIEDRCEARQRALALEITRYKSGE